MFFFHKPELNKINFRKRVYRVEAKQIFNSLKPLLHEEISDQFFNAFIPGLCRA